MTRILRTVVIGSLVAFLLTGFSAAQEIKLRPMRPIYIDALGAGIKAPEGLAFDGASRLIVADSGNRRFVLFDVSDESVSPTADFRLTQVAIPVQVRFDSDGGVLALDGKSHKIARMDANGVFKSFVELEPAKGQRSSLIKSFDVADDGKLYILETAGSRIVVLSSAGDLVRTIAFAPEVEFLSDLAVNASGVVFAIDSVSRRIFVARRGDAALTPLTESMGADMAFPTAIAADGMGLLYVSDHGGHGIIVIGENGKFLGRHSSRGRTQGFLWHPAGLDAAGDYLFVADRGNNRVQVFLIQR